MMGAEIKWPTKRLSELAEFRNGVNYNKSSFGKGIKVVGVADFQSYTKPRYDELDQINPEGIVTERNILNDGDIVFVRSNGNRELIGRSLFIERPPEEVTHSAFTIRLRFISHEVHPKFYAYCFRSPIIRKGLTASGGGTNISNLNQDILNSLEVPFPPLPLQRRISDVLSAYDELIENNQRRIRILEDMARSLYREWFVHFRYPGHESAPLADSSLGQIPQGWAVMRILDFGKVITGKTPSKANSDFYGEDVPFVKTPDMHGNMFLLSTGESLSKAGANSQANKRTPAGSICVSCIGTIGVVSITTEDCQTNQQINSIVLEKEQFREFLFFLLQDSKQALENLGSNGATMGNVNKSKFESVEVIAPPNELLERYHQFSAGLLSEILILSRQSANLRSTRDLLLPRLLSGQVNLATDTPPIYDEDEFKRMVEKGAQAWAGVSDSAAWVETLRGSKE